MASQPLPCTAPLHVTAAEALLGDLRSGAPIEARRLRAVCNELAGGTAASGAWSMREAYDALELAQVLYLIEANCPLLEGAPKAIIARLADFTAALPVQSVRS